MQNNNANQADTRGQTIFSHAPPPPQVVDAGKWVKIITSVLGTFIVLCGIVWGAATIVANTTSHAEFVHAEDRILEIEKNDIRQTVLLENIAEALKNINEKMDNFISK